MAIADPGDRDNLTGVRELLDDCVHCGFCLPACPTYSLWGQEMDSPRGRIYLMDEVLSGCPIGGAPLEHFDRCLSCMACVSACPSGVRYGEIIEAARVEIERTVERPRADRWARSAIFGLFPYPRRLRVARLALAAAQASGLRSVLQRPEVAARLPALFRAMESVAPAVSPIEVLPTRIPAEGARRGVVGLLTGCVQSVFFSQVNSATARVLAAEGFDVVVPPRQGCCGALSWHAGRRAEAARFARHTVDAFKSEGVEHIVVNAAGCGSAMKEYTMLLSGQPGYADDAAWLAAQTRDLSELLVSVGAKARRHPVNMKVAYHDACHLAHAQGIRAQPRALLQEIPGLQVSEIQDEFCCGSAGIYNLVEPDAARQLGDRKAAAIVATGAEVVVSTNPGCLMQVQSAMRRSGAVIRTAHLAEILDISLRGDAAAPP
ncbi:MAG TPA: heterodisulfide reductase-related iron-sulfur binding cluster [Acidimicrobiales bacterium]|nr:heterodisulfide reductase-related iron-sulfur binding cluster [Acidimicrobiales bacterium]